MFPIGNEDMKRIRLTYDGALPPEGGSLNPQAFKLVDADTNQPLGALVQKIEFVMHAKDMLPVLTLTVLPEYVEFELPAEYNLKTATTYDILNNLCLVRPMPNARPLTQAEIDLLAERARKELVQVDVGEVTPPPQS